MFNKKIVIISNYFPPEMGAAANRIQNMAEGLHDRGNEVTIICPIPNYPLGKIFKEYKGKFKVKEEKNEILIERYWVFPSVSRNMFVRFLSMISFAFSMWFSLFSLLKKKPNLIIVQSPPLFVALSGLLLSKLIRSKSILNVSDLWPLSALELGKLKKGVLYSILEEIEKINYRLADKIIGQSEETINYISNSINKDCLVYRNVPFFKETTSKPKNKTLKIVYAGLLGYAQGLLGLCKQINFKELNVEFHIYGSGMEENEIRNYIKNNDTTIFFHGRLNSDIIKIEILKYDVALVCLVDYIYGAVPSKIFDLMQLKTPILFSGLGEGAEIVKNEEIGLCSEPNDLSKLIENIETFKNMDTNSYTSFSDNCYTAHLNKFNLELEMDKLVNFIDYF